MKTILLVEVEHKLPIADLPEKVAGRAYTLDGVQNAEVVDVVSLRAAMALWKDANGFTAAELAMAAGRG